MKNFSLKNLSKKSVIGLLVALVGLVNAVLIMLGKNPLDISDDTIYTLVSVIVSVGSTIYVAYKNNDVTTEGKLGTEHTSQLKATRTEAGGESAGNTAEEQEIEEAEPESVAVDESEVE